MLTNAFRPGEGDQKKAAFRVGDWLVEPAWNRIRSGDRVSRLEPRVMQLLLVLAGEPGRVFTRDELLDAVWRDVTVNEEALSRAISQLRGALDDDSRDPRYVRTVHKRGYCLVALVGEVARDGLVGPVAVGWQRWAIATLMVSLAALLFFGLADRDAPPSSVELVPVPVTSEPGREIDPSLSRNGSRLSFGAQSDAGYDLFWRTIGEDRVHRLSIDGKFGGHPAWSPNGDRLAFVRVDGGGSQIRIVTLATGAARTVLTLDHWIAGLDWSPDGATLAFGDAGPGRPHSIVLLDLATGSRRTLTNAPSSGGDLKPAFSPDGRRLAFLRDAGLGLSRIFVLDLSDPQTLRPVTRQPDDIRGFDWDASGGSIVYSARQARKFGLYRAMLEGNLKPSAIPTEGGDLFNPNIALTGRLTAEAVERDRDVWRAAIGGREPSPIVRSTFDDYDAAVTLDGRRMAFVSERSGAPEIWVSGAGGETPARLTRFGGAELGRPTWSPDGQKLAFHARLHGHISTFVAELGTRRLRQVTGAAEAPQVPIGWSQRGDVLFLARGIGSGWQVRRHDLRSGKSLNLTSAPAGLAAVSGGGANIYLVTDDGRRLTRVEPQSRRTDAFDLPPELHGAAGMLSNPAGLFITVPNKAGTAIYRLTIGKGVVLAKLVATLPTYENLSIAADGSILFTRERETSNDIVLIDLGK